MVDASRKGKVGLIARMVDGLVDAPELTNVELAALVGASPTLVKAIRKSDSFRAIHAKAYQERYGELIRTFQQNTVSVANKALHTLQEVMKDPSSLPSSKIEAARLSLEFIDKVEARKAPTTPNAQTHVTINLSSSELAEARQAAISHGQIIELEPVDHAHTTAIPSPRRISHQ